MAECNVSLLQFDSALLDVNKNPSNTENQTFPDTVEIHESVPSNIDTVNHQNDLTSCEPLHSLHENKCFEMPEISSEVRSNTLDVVSQNTIEIVMNSNSGIHDSENNFIENSKLIDFAGDLNLSNGCRVISEFKNEENCVEMKDEEFHDAVQFFKDPSCLTFLENAGSSNTSTDPLLTRSSLYMNFDPLHAKFYSQSSVASHELQEIEEVEPEMPSENGQNDSLPVIINKHLVNASPRESLGNILISFDSPVTSKNIDSESVVKDKQDEPQKTYTEEELQQALKIQELSIQETFLKRQHDLEIERTLKQQEMESKIQEQSLLCSALHSVLKEVLEITVMLSDKEKVLHQKLEDSETENNKLKEDLKTSAEDLQSVESTFSDFHKRYEQCKSMLKVYTQNEDNLKHQLEDMKVQLHEKDEMYKVLQSRTEEMLDKANTEVSNAKKAGDSQVAVLKAQLKKAELKISSLESDVKHVKIENGKLSSICDELMVKVSES